jgi:hypothetical protein
MDQRPTTVHAANDVPIQQQPFRREPQKELLVASADLKYTDR